VLSLLPEIISEKAEEGIMLDKLCPFDKLPCMGEKCTAYDTYKKECLWAGSSEGGVDGG